MKASPTQKSIELLGAGEKREVVMQLRSVYPIAVICEVLNYPRFQVYYQAQAKVDESDLKAVIGMIAGRYPRYGYRRMTEQLKREGHVVNHKRVLRLMREMGIEGKRPCKRKRTTNSQHGYGRYPLLKRSIQLCNRLVFIFRKSKSDSAVFRLPLHFPDQPRVWIEFLGESAQRQDTGDRSNFLLMQSISIRR